MGYLDYAGLQYLWGKLKEKFALKSHSHDDRYYTEAEVNGKLNSKVDNNEAGANGLLSKLTTSWTAIPTDNTYFIRQDTGGGNEFGRVKFSTIWSYIKGKADGVYQPKGSYAASGHTHDDRYYTESEINTKLAGKSNTDHTHNTSSIGVGNVNYAGGAGPIEAAHIDVLRANRLAFLPASGVKVEYSTDGGSTWIDYGATDAQKASLFAMRMGSATPFYTGKHTKTDECTTKDQLRITIAPVDRYASVNMLYLWVSVAGTSATVNISRSTIGAKETFTDVRTDVPISGWSGPNEIRFSGGTFGGGSTQTSNAYAYRFTFKNKADGKGSVSVMDIRMYGPSAWSIPNSMMEKDHIYNWDVNQNVHFPAQVTATKFNGSSTGVVDYGDSNGSTIKVGYNGAGLTKDKLTHIAGYSKDGNQTVIKDVDRGVLQSWLNLNEMINTQLTTGSSTPSDNDFYISQYAGGGATITTYHRRPISALWNYIKSKADAVYSAKSHTHTKSQITDFPASLKNPTALTIQTNGTTAATYDGSAEKIVNVTKGNIGLGNVDNTADVDKSVKYATSAGNADTALKLYGFDGHVGAQTWGVQIGTFVHGEDVDSGSFAFRKNCPASGQLSMVIDGKYYQNEGNYPCVDTSGGDMTGYLNFGQTNTGLSWTCANGDIYHLRPWSPNNVFQLTRQNPNGIGEYGVFNVIDDGNMYFCRPGFADAFPMLGTVACGSNYIRFGDGTQICWGAITYNYQSASEISFPVPFVNTSYAVSGFLSIHSGVENIIRFGNKSTSSFRITIQNGNSSQLDWMAIGRWC